MITFLTLLIALVGILLLGILSFQVKTLGKELKIKKHRGQEKGFVDLLNYAAVVEDGIIVCKNGAFMASWIYQGEDNTGTTDEEREIISFRINQVLSKLKSGWMLHVDAVRRPAPSYSDRNQSHFPDAISKAIDEERRQLFEGMDTLYEGAFILTLTWFPPILAERKFVELMFDDEGENWTKKGRTFDLIEKFKREILTIEGGLSGCVNLTRLKGKKTVSDSGKEITLDEFLSWLQFCVTGLNHPVILPDNPMYIDALIGGQEFWKGIVPKIGNNFIQCIAIEGFPLEGHPEILSMLAELPIEYRWSSRFIFLDNHEAEAALEKYRKKWQQKVRGFFDQVFNTNKSSIDKDALDMVRDAEDAIAEINTGFVGEGYYTSVVVLMNEDRKVLDTNARFIAKAINDLGFSARIETINTVDAWIGSFPGHGVENVRRPLMHTYNLSHLLPTSTVWTGENKAPSPMFPEKSPPLMHCVTGGNSPFRVNLHVRDLGHSIVFGPTRTGKSTLLANIALQWRRYKDARVIVFDKGMSMFPTCLATGGTHYTILGDEDRLSFAPFQYLQTREDRAWAMNWVDNILLLNGVITTPTQRNEIGNAIISMYQSGSKTFSEFSVLIQDESIRDALKQYTVDGLMGHLLDAEEDKLGFSNFMVFEMEKLMKFDEKYVLPVLLYIFRRIETSLDGRPTLIQIDEAWLMFSHPVFRGYIEQWLVSFAKLNCAVLLSTQNPAQAVKSGILDTIAESTASKIFLPNSHARNHDVAALYEYLGCSKKHLDIIATATPKRDYLYLSEKGSRVFDLALGPLTLAITGNTDRDSIEMIKDLHKKMGDSWIEHWLQQKGLNLKNYGVNV